ncbi:MAG: hypothetical protein HY377_00355 [Candidatus Blackburnbacteria bacterium]|nr:hypothetical protein [Candidatus Blackburnbacteria bacterium]
MGHASAALSLISCCLPTRIIPAGIETTSRTRPIIEAIIFALGPDDGGVITGGSPLVSPEGRPVSSAGGPVSPGCSPPAGGVVGTSAPGVSAGGVGGPGSPTGGTNGLGGSGIGGRGASGGPPNGEAGGVSDTRG